VEEAMARRSATLVNKFWITPTKEGALVHRSATHVEMYPQIIGQAKSAKLSGR
jgi:hypothetical protein